MTFPRFSQAEQDRIFRNARQGAFGDVAHALANRILKLEEAQPVVLQVYRLPSGIYR